MSTGDSVNTGRASAGGSASVVGGVRHTVAAARLGLIAAPALLFFACGGSSPTPESTRVAPVLSGETTGGPCAVDADCRSGVCDRTVPDGYCTSECSDAQPCAVGDVCTGGLCLAGCHNQRECRAADFECFEVSPDQGVCMFDARPFDGAAPNIGAPCRAAVECVAPEGLEAFCISAVDLTGGQTSYVDGMCVALGCGASSPCGDGAVCAIGGPLPYCLASCEAGCREGYACDEAVGGCVPAEAP